MAMFRISAVQKAVYQVRPQRFLRVRVTHTI